MRAVNGVGLARQADSATGTCEDARRNCGGDRSSFVHSPSEAARSLAEIVGMKVASEAVGMSETRALRQWIDGSRSIQAQDTLARLYLVLDLALALSELFEVDAVARWFQLYNRHLDGKTPIQFLNTVAIDDAGPRLLALVSSYSAIPPSAARDAGTQLAQ